MELSEHQKTLFNDLTKQYSFSLKSQEIAEYVIKRFILPFTEKEIEEVENVFNFRQGDFGVAIYLAELVLLEEELSQCGINDGSFYRSAVKKRSIILENLKSIKI